MSRKRLRQDDPDEVAQESAGECRHHEGETASRVFSGPRPLSANGVIALQGAAGNVAVSALAASGKFAVQRADLDDTMAEHAATAGQAAENDAAMQLVITRTVLNDMAAAKGLADKIGECEPGVRKAESEHDEYAGSLARNTNTKFQLQLFSTSLQETDRNLGDFQSFYATAKTDYSRLLGMARAYVGKKRPKGTDQHALDVVATDMSASSLKQQASAMKDGDALYRDKVREWKEARNKLATASDRLTEVQGDSTTKLNKMLSVSYDLQKKAAGVKAAKDQAKLDAVNAKINETVNNITFCVQLAGKLSTSVTTFFAAGRDPFTGAEVPGIADPRKGETYIPTNIGSQERRDAKKELAGQHVTPKGTLAPGAEPSVQLPRRGEPGYNMPTGTDEQKEEAEGIKERAPTDPHSATSQLKAVASAAGHLKGLASEGDLKDLTDPKKILERLIKEAEKETINDLKASIAAAKEEESLAGAEKDAADLATARSEWKNAITKIGTIVGAFLAAQNEMKRLGAEVAKHAKKRNPQMAAAFRFLTESDTFLAKTDVAIKFGGDQQASGAQAGDRRVAISGDTDPTNPKAGNLYYYEPYKVRVKNWYGKVTVDNRLRRVQVELPNDTSGPGGFVNERGTSGTLGGTHGAQNVVAVAVQELEDWKVEITALRNQLQNTLGVGQATKNLAL